MTQKIQLVSEQLDSFTFLLRNYMHYNLWTNITLLKWLETKPQELLEKEIPSSFSSIKLTLQHMWKTQGYWFAIIRKVDDYNPEYYSDCIAGIISGMRQQSAEISLFVENLTAAQLNEKVCIRSPWFTCAYPISEYVMQVVNHNTYHRGQIVSIGRALGFTDAPNTDYNFYNVIAQ